METLIKLNNQTSGRDKIARLLQYLSRILWHRLQHRNKDHVNAFKNLEFQLSSFRKILRFGRCVDTLYSALPLLNHPDPKVKHSLILSKIAHSIFLLADHLLWIGRANLCNVDTDKWGRLSNKYWLLSITMNLVRDFYELSGILMDHKQQIVLDRGIRNFNDLYQTLMRTLMVLQSNRSVMIDTIKNGCDVFIPLAALGHLNLSPGVVGWLGVISSLAGLLPLINPRVKLTPI